MKKLFLTSIFALSFSSIAHASNYNTDHFKEGTSVAVVYICNEAANAIGFSESKKSLKKFESLAQISSSYSDLLKIDARKWKNDNRNKNWNTFWSKNCKQQHYNLMSK